MNDSSPRRVTFGFVRRESGLQLPNETGSATGRREESSVGYIAFGGWFWSYDLVVVLAEHYGLAEEAIEKPRMGLHMGPLRTRPQAMSRLQKDPL